MAGDFLAGLASLLRLDDAACAAFTDQKAGSPGAECPLRFYFHLQIDAVAEKRRPAYWPRHEQSLYAGEKAAVGGLPDPQQSADGQGVIEVQDLPKASHDAVYWDFHAEVLRFVHQELSR